MSKRLMILGAGLFQLTAIKKAVELGYHVITVDYTPENPGHRISNACVNCSTVDKEGVLRAAEKLSIDGICTFASDVSLPAVGYVCDSLGLGGLSLGIAETLSQKHLFRAFLKVHGQKYPEYAAGSRFLEVERFISESRRTLMAKPVDSSGSRGVSKFCPSQDEAAKKAFDFAHPFSRSGRVIVEEFIEGEEVGGEGILRNGVFSFIAITHKHVDGFIVQGHSLPSSLSEDDQARVITTLERACALVGYRNGPLNFDVMVSPGDITIIEMSPRNGGNGIPAVIHRHFGVDVERITLRMAVNEIPEQPKLKEPRPACGSLVFGSPKAGTLVTIADEETLRAAVEGLHSLTCTAHPGDAIEAFAHNGNSIGYALFDTDDYDETVEKIKGSLQIEVIPF